MRRIRHGAHAARRSAGHPQPPCGAWRMAAGPLRPTVYDEHDPATAERGRERRPVVSAGDGLMSASRLPASAPTWMLARRSGAGAATCRSGSRWSRSSSWWRSARSTGGARPARGADPDELGVDHAWLDGSVFPDYTIPGLMLLVVIGGGMLIAAAVAVWAPRKAGLAAEVMAAALLVWGTVETFTIGRVARPSWS